MKKFLAALCFAGFAAISTAALADSPAPVSTPVLNTDQTVIGQKVAIPQDPTVLVTTMVFAPGARTAVHKHLYAHYAYVLEGTLTVTNAQTGKSFDLGPGQFLVEMQDTWHYGVNKGKVPVRLLVVDQVPKGTTANSVVMDPKEAASRQMP